MSTYVIPSIQIGEGEFLTFVAVAATAQHAKVERLLIKSLPVFLIFNIWGAFFP